VRRAAAALAALVLVAGCRTLAPAPPGAPLPADDPRIETLLGELERRAEERRSMRAAARLFLDAPDLRFRRPQRVVAERPDRLRVETVGLFGQLISVLVTGGGQYQLYDVGSGGFEQGPLTPALLWRVARVELRAEQAVELLLGAPGRGPGSAVAGARELDDGSIAVELKAGQGVPRQRFRFDADGRLRHVSQLGESGQPLWEAGFDDYRELAGAPFAFRVELWFPDLEARAVFTFKSVELDPALPEDVFSLRLPAQTVP
jgi:hypothetical protein